MVLKLRILKSCAIYCYIGVLFIIINSAKSQDNFKPDYSHKKKVSVSDALKGLEEPNGRVDNSWAPPVDSNRESVKINILGSDVDPTALNYLKPDTSTRQERKLARILGEDFDIEWTSIKAPREARYIDKEGDKKVVDPVLAVEVRKLNMTLYDGLGRPYKLPAHLSDMFESWLVDHATCKLTYVWESLGTLFWPSWIRRGLCKTSQSCSWPPGMSCHPTSSRTVKLLHWNCTKDVNSAKKKRWASRKRRRGRRDRRRGMQRDEAKRNRRRSRDNLTPRQRRARRAKRLIRKLSKTTSGFHCEWNIKSYMTNDRCACSCS